MTRTLERDYEAFGVVPSRHPPWPRAFPITTDSKTDGDKDALGVYESGQNSWGTEWAEALAITSDYKAETIMTPRDNPYLMENRIPNIWREVADEAGSSVWVVLRFYRDGTVWEQTVAEMSDGKLRSYGSTVRVA